MQTRRPCCVGPAGFLAVLGLIGVWLNSLRAFRFQFSGRVGAPTQTVL